MNRIEALYRIKYAALLSLMSESTFIVQYMLHHASHFTVFQIQDRMANRLKDIQLLGGTENEAEKESEKKAGKEAGKEGEDSLTVRDRDSNKLRERMLSIYNLNIIRPSALYIFQDASVLCMPFAELGEREGGRMRMRGKEEGRGNEEEVER
jgi:hypothetical protein